jgi:hypothetical protein
LTLPSTLIAFLGLVWLGRAQAMLGDGTIQLVDVYEATVIWDSRVRIVETDAADVTPLVGMGLIYGHDLRIQGVEGGTVTIEALQ